MHLEGTFLSSKYQGAHKVKYLEKPSIELFKKYLEASRNNIKYVIIAPDLNNALELIKYLVDNGVVVNLGHSNATLNEVNVVPPLLLIHLMQWFYSVIII